MAIEDKEIEHRKRAKALAREAESGGDPSAWFEPLYQEARAAGDNSEKVPWADLQPNRSLVECLDTGSREWARGHGKTALVVGCGLGDDAEELSRRGYTVTAFDIAHAAVEWCYKRFPETDVLYQVTDLRVPPDAWKRAFDLVVEIYTIQAVPPAFQVAFANRIAAFVAENGRLLVISRGRDEDIKPEGPPWPLSKSLFTTFTQAGLQEIQFDDYEDPDEPGVRRFRGVYEGKIWSAGVLPASGI